MTIVDFCDKLEELPSLLRVWIFDILWEHKDEILRVQRSQLWAGMDAEGNKLKPNILNDPYFAEKAAKINRKRKNKFVSASDLANSWAKSKASALNNMPVPFPLLTEPEFGTYEYGDANLIYSTGVMIWQQLNLVPIGDKKDLVVNLNNFELLQELEAKYGEPIGINPQGLIYVCETFLYKELKEKIDNHFS